MGRFRLRGAINVNEHQAQAANPWGLTRGQASAVQAMVDHGCNKAAARSLSLSTKTIEAHLTEARLKMNETNRVRMALKWDRWARSNPSGPGGAP